MSIAHPRPRPHARPTDVRLGAATGPSRRNRIARQVLLGLAVLALLANLGFALAQSRLSGESLVSAADGQSTKLVLAVPVDGDRTLTATRTNEVALVEDGAPTATAQLPKTVGAIAAAPDGQRFYAGTADGKLTVFDAALTPLRELPPVEGRVVGLATTSAGGVLVAHGVGAYGDRYFVSHFAGADDAPTFSTQIGFTISALAADGEEALFGTADSRVGRLDAAGQIRWTATLRAPVTRLLALPDGGALAGSDNGDLSRLDAAGSVTWTSNVTSYPVRGLAYDAERDTAFVGDSHGNLAAVDSTGAVRVTQSVGESDIEAILPSGSDGDRFLVVPREGTWRLLAPAALGATELGGSLRLAWLATNAALLAGAIAAALVAVERWRRVAARQLQLAWRGRLAYAFLLPGIGLIALFSYYPAGMAFYYSLTNFSLRNVTEFVGLANYREVLFDDVYFRTGFGNMALIVGTSILKTITVPLLVAELVFWLRNSVHQYLFRTLFVLPAVVPDLVFTLMWRQVYDPNTGLLNQLLGAMGLGQFRRAWLGEDETAIWAIIGVGFPFVSAFAFLIFMGGLLNVNPEYFDAAKIDGATWWDRFRHIDAPLLLPQFRILLFFAVTGAVQGFAGVFILTRGGPGYETYVPALQMYLRIAEGDLGYASAIGVVLFAMILVLTLFILRFRRNDAIEAA
jgi:ABC-type sugar transport system permease subunit